MGPAGDPRRGLLNRFHVVLAYARRHPIAVAAVPAAVIAVGQAVTIWAHRTPGSLSGDEEMYAAQAYRAIRALPFGSFRTLGTLGTVGPLVPALSALLLLVGPDDPRTVLLAQPLLLLVLAVAIAGITRRLAGPWAAIAAAVVVSVLPTTVSGSVTYFFGLGVGATLALALWALLASEGGTRRSVWAFGLFLGLMPLARTMAVAFLPALVVPAIWVGWHHPDGRRRLAIAIGLGGLIFAPVYWVNRFAIWEYLTVYGYDESTSQRFPGRTLDRPFDRFHQWQDGFGRPISWLALLLAVAGVAQWVRRGGRWPQLRRSPVVPVALCVGVGYAALISTANTGDWFDLPLIAMSTCLVVGGWARLPRVAAVGAALLFVPVGAATLGRSWRVIDSTPAWAEYQGPRYAYTEFIADQEDPRAARGDLDGQRVAADEWWRTILRIRTMVDDYAATDPGVAADLVGSAVILNGHAFSLARESTGSNGPEVGTWGEGMLLIVPVGDSPHPARVEANREARRLEREGWELVGTVPLPRHGEARLYRSPED